MKKLIKEILGRAVALAILVAGIYLFCHYVVPVLDNINRMPDD